MKKQWLITGTEEDMRLAKELHASVMKQQQGSKVSKAADRLMRTLQTVEAGRKEEELRQWIIEGTENDVWRAKELHANVMRQMQGSKKGQAAERLMRTLQLLDETEQVAQEKNERSNEK